MVTWELAEEIVEVLERPKLARYEVTSEDVMELLTVMAPLIPQVETHILPRDPDDAHVITAAVAGQADVLVTGDRGLLEGETLRTWLNQRAVRLLTPAQLTKELP